MDCDASALRRICLDGIRIYVRLSGVKEWFRLTRTCFAQPVAVSAHATPIQGTQSFLSAPKRPTFRSIARLLWQKDVPSPPIITRFSQKPPVQTAPARRQFGLALTLPPSVPYYPTPRIQPPPRPATAVPMPTSQHRQPRSPKSAHLPADTTQTATKTLPSDPNSAPRPAPCPTGISGNERKRAGNRPFRPFTTQLQVGTREVVLQRETCEFRRYWSAGCQGKRDAR